MKSELGFIQINSFDWVQENTKIFDELFISIKPLG